MESDYDRVNDMLRIRRKSGNSSRVPPNERINFIANYYFPYGKKIVMGHFRVQLPRFFSQNR